MFQLTAELIRSRTDASSFSRGRDYLAEGRLYDAVAIDDVVQARCVGSMDIDYSVTLRLGPDRIEEARCTCPRGGFCKHLVALGLLVAERPDDVVLVDTGELRRLLTERTREELVTILIERAACDTSFARSLLSAETTCVAAATGTTAATRTTAATGDPAAHSATFSDSLAEFRREADPAFRHVSNNPYRAALESAARMQELLYQAERRSRNEPHRLLAFYSALFLCIEDNADAVDDSDAALGGTAHESVQGMKRTLDTFEVDPGVQQQWLRIMIPQYLRNDYGHGDDLGEAIVAVRGDEPIALAERLIREFLADQDSPGDDDEPYERVSVWQYQYERMIAVELLAALYQRSSRGELIPMLYREHGLHYHYAVSLFQAGREEEALTHACGHLRSGYDVFRFSQVLADAGKHAELRVLLERTLPDLPRNAPYQSDLRRIYADTLDHLGDSESALDARVATFREHPSVEAYDVTLKTAASIDRRVTVESDLLAWCEEGNVPMDVLVQIHIHRGATDAALAAYQRLPEYRSDQLTFELAECAARERPEESRKLFELLIESNIARRGRSHYQQAAQIARKLELVMDGRQLAAYVADLRERYRRLPALQDELKREFGYSR